MTSTDPAVRLLADVEATRALQDTTTDGLLTAYAALTHQIHSHSMSEGGTPTDRGLREAAIASRRSERDLIRAEILRRTGDL